MQHRLTFLLGASGAGKTTVAKTLEGSVDLVVLYFDRIGVPQVEEMIQQYGSPEEWQRVTTARWVEIIRHEHLSSHEVLLDLQARPSFIEEACVRYGITNYRCVLFDCSDEVRRERLAGRGQPELADERMMNWARLLRDDCLARGHTTIDTTELTVPESAERLKAFITPGRAG